MTILAFEGIKKVMNNEVLFIPRNPS